MPSIKPVAKAAQNVVLDTQIVPKKKLPAPDDFFPESTPIPDELSDKLAQAENDKKAKEIGDMVGRIIDYFG